MELDLPLIRFTGQAEAPPLAAKNPGKLFRRVQEIIRAGWSIMAIEKVDKYERVRQGLRGMC